MIKGYVVNNSGRSKHIFKMNIGPGIEVSLDRIYDTYKDKYRGKFDTDFLKWFKKNKLPKDGGFEIIVDDILDEEDGRSIIEKEAEVVQKKHPSELTSTEISNLKVRDRPKEKLKYVTSIYKLRRALGKCKHKRGKDFLVDLIHDRIKEIHKESKDSA